MDLTYYCSNLSEFTIYIVFWPTNDLLIFEKLCPRHGTASGKYCFILFFLSVIQRFLPTTKVKQAIREQHVCNEVPNSVTGPRFGRPVPQLSMLCNIVIDHIFHQFGHLLSSFDQQWLSRENLKVFADVIHEKGAALDNCWGFIDGTVHPICRPKRNQRVVYNGHKRVHALKYQSVVAPNGLIAHLFGPVEGRRHDSGMLKHPTIPFHLMVRYFAYMEAWPTHTDFIFNVHFEQISNSLNSNSLFFKSISCCLSLTSISPLSCNSAIVSTPLYTLLFSPFLHSPCPLFHLVAPWAFSLHLQQSPSLLLDFSLPLLLPALPLQIRLALLLSL